MPREIVMVWATGHPNISAGHDAGTESTIDVRSLSCAAIAMQAKMVGSERAWMAELKALYGCEPSKHSQPPTLLFYLSACRH